MSDSTKLANVFECKPQESSKCQKASQLWTPQTFQRKNFADFFKGFAFL